MGKGDGKKGEAMTFQVNPGGMAELEKDILENMKWIQARVEWLGPFRQLDRPGSSRCELHEQKLLDRGPSRDSTCNRMATVVQPLTPTIAN
jgi:hypothetical protein